ncbi:hypothetical protein C5C36_14835, partial [Rathayibacter sp. AY1G1]|uniref:hypothetical protein n=1 Tax=Rathayibacter sp. AY1G1 TaxID=2080564 RepID=UPI000D4D3C8F
GLLRLEVRDELPEIPEVQRRLRRKRQAALLLATVDPEAVLPLAEARPPGAILTGWIERGPTSGAG